MDKWFNRIGVAACIAAAIFVSREAQSQAVGLANLSPGAQLLLSRLQVGATLDRYIENLRNDFFQLDADSDGKLTQMDIDLHETIEASQARVSSATTIMRFDLDGDNAVTEDEMRIVLRYNARATLAAPATNPNPNSVQAFLNATQQIESSVRTFMALDTDKDGKLTYSEVSKPSLPASQRARDNWSARIKQVQTVATASNGDVTLNDFQGAGEALFRSIDTDNDGKISQQEFVEYWRRPTTPDAAAQAKALDAAMSRAQQAEAGRKPMAAQDVARAGCTIPAPSPKAKVVLLSTYQTEALSSVAIGSQDAVIHAGPIAVEAGDDPLYLVIPTYGAMIWQFSGAVDRIERLVMSSLVTGANGGSGNMPPLVGATGLPKDRISFLAKSSCFNYFSELPSSQSVQAVATVREATGQEPFKVIAAYSAMGFSVPSGKVESLAKDGRRPLVIQKSEGSLRIEGDASNYVLRAGPSRARDDLYSYSPGGLIEIDPKSVISSLPAQMYEVFPQEAGLVQLLETGALTQNRTGEYIVRRKTRFPAGLNGAHSVKFLVLRGTPLPDGDPGHSCVAAEDATASKFPSCR